MGLFSSFSDSASIPSPNLGVNTALNDLQITPKSVGVGGTNSVASGNDNMQLDTLYKPTPANWYTAKPYGFKLKKRDGTQFIMFLPISPSNINVTTHFATNMIPTLYGTVEEHSDVRYYDIVIEGTTGIAPKFTEVANGGGGNTISSAYDWIKQPGRAKFDISSSVALGGFFSNTISQVSNLLNQADKAIQGITGNVSKQETAVYTDQTGYMAFHSLYRFLLAYKKDAAGLTIDGDSNPLQYSSHPLTFFNYKDGNQYSVVIRNFQLRRSADNPMLYNYSIVMRGYNLASSGNDLAQLENLSQRLKDLGLDGVKSSTLLTRVKGVSNAAKAVVGSAANGVNLFGR